MAEIAPTQNTPGLTNPLLANNPGVNPTPISDEQRFSDALAASQVAPDPELVSEAGRDTEEIEDRFLTLLIAQMTNQDPLNPLENAEVTTQMAQINTASGIESINTQMAEMLAQFDSSNPLDGADMLGREVLVASDVLNVTDPGVDGAIGGVNIPGLTPDATVEVLGDDGSVIRRISLGYQTAGVSTFAWDGLTNSGEVVEPGSYKFRVLAGSENGAEVLTSLSASRVLGVTRGDGSVGLQLEGGTQVSSDDVYGIY